MTAAQQLVRPLITIIEQFSKLIAAVAILAGASITIALLPSGDPSSEPHELLFWSIPDRNDLPILRAPAPDFATVPESARHLFDTERRNQPFWFLSEPFQLPSAGPAVLEIASRHVTTASLWLLDSTGRVVSHGDSRPDSRAALHYGKAGWFMVQPSSAGSYHLLVHLKASGPAKVRLKVWEQAAHQAATVRYNTNGGLLFGSLLMIAGFGAILSLLTRDVAFFYFAGWVIVSLRITSYMAGWDFSWMEIPWLEEHTTLTRNLPLAAYGILTVSLFRTVFRNELSGNTGGRVTSALLGVSFLLPILAVALPHEQFLPVLWSIAIPSLFVLILLSIRILLKTGSPAAFWYSASWVATLGGIAAEVFYAVGTIHSKPMFLNTVSGTVASSIFAGVALAERIKLERRQKVLAQKRSMSLLQRFRDNYNSMPIGLFSARMDGRLALCNPEFSRIFDIPSYNNELRLEDLLGRESATRLFTLREQLPVIDCELYLLGDDGQPRWFQARTRRSRNGIEGSIQDITARKLAEQKLERLATHDNLTGLLNRNGLDLALERLLETSTTGHGFAVAYIDLDRFKVVNDLHGHATGDALLKMASQRIRPFLRNGDLAGRIGDSFVLLLDSPDEHETRETCDGICVEISKTPFAIRGKALSMTASIGAIQVAPGLQAMDAIAMADRACVEAKSRGRNQVVIISGNDDSLQTHLNEVRLMTDMQSMQLIDRYFLEFQPIISLGGAENLLSYEALIRMRGEDGKTIPPGQFIGAAERNGLMSDIDRWVLRSMLEWLDEHPEHRDRLHFATLNLSGASLNDARFVEDAFAMLAEHPLAVRKLCFEVTESVALHDIKVTRRLVDRVRSLGARLALDDFGSGYTSFRYLREIPADLIKIDGSFVRDITRNPADHAITRMIVELGHELGMESIAEWAEDLATIQALVELGVSYGQGYALARPMAKEIVTAAASGLDLIGDPQVAAFVSRPRPAIIALS